MVAGVVMAAHGWGWGVWGGAHTHVNTENGLLKLVALLTVTGPLQSAVAYVRLGYKLERTSGSSIL